MEFTLLYQGPLKSRGSAKQKQEIRRVFHPQLKLLWSQQPLNGFNEFLQENPDKGKTSILQKIGQFVYAPLINDKLKVIAELGDLICLLSTHFLLDIPFLSDHPNLNQQTRRIRKETRNDHPRSRIRYFE
ncbi:MAG: hypothetical protein JRJ77_09175 [Deltaproteobacteria bacterium]|nr:hypothetical protein [Deltaproteobacteria bacterium]MBW2339771.1 hypothetical protein [Deltaproteobacteria bacterium]